MGCDIHGTVEVSKREHWYPVIDAGNILSRNSDLFGCLFGVRNHANFVPLFPERGIPDDFSGRTQYEEIRESGLPIHSETWCSFKELSEVRQNEVAHSADSLIYHYKVSTDGKETLLLRSGFFAPIADIHDEILQKGEVRRDDMIYRANVRLTRADALEDKSYQLLYKLMGILAEDYGPEHVRLVVWFDN